MLEPIAMLGRPHAWRRIALAVLVVLLIQAIASGQPNFERAAVTGAASQQRVAQGGEFAIALVMDFQPTWHAWPAEGQLDRLPEDFREFVLPTRFELAETPEWISAVGDAQLPETHAAPVPNLTGDGPPTIEVQTYSGRAIAYLPIRLAPDAPLGATIITASVFYQACDETTCMPPLTATVEIPIEIVTLENAGGAPADPALFEGFDPTAYATLAPPAGAATEPEPVTEPSEAAPAQTASGRTFFGIPVPAPDGPAGIIVLALLSALGGFILNLTPCVLPVIPIKVLTISRHAGSPGKSLVLGLAMAAGVVAFWVAIGVPVAFLTGVTDPSRLFGIWWVTLGIGVVIGLMGVGIMGLFSINLPQQVYMVNPKADSVGGSFLFGVMTAVLGLPCFGFVAGALLAGAATLPPAVIMVIFGSLGLGMAAPYLVLSAKPSLVEKLPRTGPASELVKQVMGLLLLAAAAYFVGSGLIGLLSEMPWLARQIHWWVVALFVTIAALWLVVRTIQITRRPIPRAVFGVVGLALAAVAVLYASDSTAKARQAYMERQAALAAAGAGEGQLVSGVWLDYSEALLQQARDEGYTVVLDFTAEWCLNCKALKAAVLNREPVKSALRDDRVVSMTVDLTSTTAPGWDKLRDLGQTGIPLLVVYGPGLEEPWQSNAYTSGQVLDALARAAGEAPGVARTD